MLRPLLCLSIAIGTAGCAATDGIHNASKVKDAVFYAKDVAKPMTDYAHALETANPDGTLTADEAARLQQGGLAASRTFAELKDVDPPDRLAQAHTQLIRGVGQSAQALKRMSAMATAHNRTGYARASQAFATSEQVVGTALQQIAKDSGIPLPKPQVDTQPSVQR
jgi:hypothetical protein